MGNPLRRQDVCCYYLLILLEKFLHQIEMCNESISILQGMAVWAASLERESQPGEQDSLGEPVYYPEVSEPFTGRQGSGVWGRVPAITTVNGCTPYYTCPLTLRLSLWNNCIQIFAVKESNLMWCLQCRMVILREMNYSLIPPSPEIPIIKYTFLLSVN